MPDVAPDIAPDMFGASPGPRSPALHRAARRGDIDRVRRLLDAQKQDVNETDANGSTALMWACQFGHDDVVEALLRRGADARARNAFNWSALEYASTSSLAGDVLFALLPEVYPGVVDASSLTTRTVVTPAALSGAYGALLGDWSRYVQRNANATNEEDAISFGSAEGPSSAATTSRGDAPSPSRTRSAFSFPETDGLAPFARSGTKARSPARLSAVARNAAARYVSSAATSFRDARDALSSRDAETTRVSFPRLGSVAIAGCTRKPLGLYAGQRYEIRALFWRRRTSGDSSDANDGDIVPAVSSNDPPRPSPDHVLCAELHNPTWTPWGSIEVEVRAAELRSVRDEIRWAVSTAAAFAACFVAAGALARGGHFAVSVASVPSNSMAPGILRGDAVLADRRRASLRAVAAGDVVLFAPPPRLARAVLETRGSAPAKSELFVKRVVGVAGDELEIVHGAVFRNGTRETPYATGTPVGVAASRASPVCDVCVAGSYDLRPTRVPPGQVFVLGDNRGASVDGHVWGYLPLENVRGVVRFRVGPPHRFGALEETPKKLY